MIERCATMKKEVYKMQCPEHIVFGDPLYFEEFQGGKLQSVVVDYRPPRHFEARMVLLEQESEQLKNFMERSMTLYFAPAKTIKTYMDGMQYESQQVKEKVIGVDTARYLLAVNGRSDVIHTGGDGYWGSETELYRQIGTHKISDAVIISVVPPDETDFEGMRQMAHYFFPDMRRMDKDEKKKKRGDTAR